jgi:hypothetical protein
MHCTLQGTQFINTGSFSTTASVSSKKDEIIYLLKDIALKVWGKAPQYDLAQCRQYIIHNGQLSNGSPTLS